MNDDRYGMTAANLLAAFPDALKADASLYALASAAAEVLSWLRGEMEKIRIYPRISELPESLLDILAYDFKVDWWDPDYSIEEKRQILRDSWNIHRTVGTKAAVEQAISAIYRNTKVFEWFEYGGAPYEFKLLIDAGYEEIEAAKHRRVLDRVEYYKNLRSTPFSVEYVTRMAESDSHAASAAGLTLRIAFAEDASAGISGAGSTYAAGAASASARMSFGDPPPAITGSAGSCTASKASIALRMGFA